MAEAAVGFLLENLKQLLLYRSDLIVDATSQVESLESDMRMFRSFLKKFNRRSDMNAPILLNLVKEIRSIVYDIEDAIDSFIIEANKRKRLPFLNRLVHRPFDLKGVTKEVARIREKIQIMMERDFKIHTEDQDPKPLPVPRVREDNIVGFNEEANNIFTYIMEATEELDVISIIGLPGLGKTTLAGKVFRDPRIEYEFPTRIWVYVSQEFKRRDVFLTLLKNFNRNTYQLEDKTDQEIAHTLRDHLDRTRFLIVMDDVWSAEAWSELKDAFPKINRMGKILITSRNVEVAHQANRNREPYKLRFLDDEESLLLLQLEVFGKPSCPEDLEPYGRTIVEKCRGLPLAIVVIGGLLLKKSGFGDTLNMKNTWRMVAENVPAYLTEDLNVNNIIALSYNALPFHLKPCFLYLGMFPKDIDIPVWNLIRLWIAEGFINGRAGISQEQIAEDYMRELIRYNLVQVGKVSLDGQIKTCRVHSLLSEFCKNEAGAEKEDSFQEFERSAAQACFMPSIETLEICHRVCIHSSILDFISMPQLSGPRVRSFLCYSKEESYNLPLAYHSAIPAAFKLLRVLDTMPITFSKFPRDLLRLVHLRYVVLSSNFKVIPEAVAELWNLQTLVIYTSSGVLEIKANIWKMLQLRHVKTNACAILPRTGKSPKEGSENLQTLESISPQSCTDDVCDRLHNLRILSIRGLLVLLLDINGLQKLENLDKLKLVNDLDSSPSQGRLKRLPHAYKFPPRLRRLTLCATNLEWSHMATLGLLGYLQVLKLKKNAFIGERLETRDGGFRYLEVLQIDDTDLEVWETEANHFPRLKCLVLRKCEQLGEIPYKLSEVPSFERLDLEHVPKAVDSAKKIEKAKKMQQELGLETFSGIKFKLNITPVDE